MKTRIFRNLARAFARQERGAASIEVVLWTPIFLLLFGMVTDASIVFGRQAEILRIVQDANRSLAVGRFLTIDQAETYIQERVTTFSDESSVDVSVTGGIITSEVTLPASDLTSTGLFEAINSLTLTIAASQMSEV
jgi:Flp pilus assembly protein TadG